MLPQPPIGRRRRFATPPFTPPLLVASRFRLLIDDYEAAPYEMPPALMPLFSPPLLILYTVDYCFRHELLPMAAFNELSHV